MAHRHKAIIGRIRRDMNKLDASLSSDSSRPKKRSSKKRSSSKKRGASKKKYPRSVTFRKPSRKSKSRGKRR